MEEMMVILVLLHFNYGIALCQRNKKGIYWFYIAFADFIIGAFIKPFIAVWLLLQALFVLIDILIVKAGEKNSGNVDAILVLGHGLEDNKPSKTLKNRLEKALEVAESYPNARIILSGGFTGSGISEAEAMKEFLLLKGMKEEKIYLEEKSTTTIENFFYMKERYPELLNMNCLIVSSEYHLLRARQIAKRTGYPNISAIGSASEKFLLPDSLLKEKYLLLMKK